MMTQMEIVAADYEEMGKAYSEVMKHVDTAIWCFRCGRQDLALVALHRAQASDRGVADMVAPHVVDELEAMHRQAVKYECA